MDVSNINRLRSKGVVAKIDEIPRCTICSNEGVVEVPQAVVDARSIHGWWAYMCPSCFAKHGIGIGIGLGQILVKVGS